MTARARQGCTGCWKATPLSRHRGRAEIRITDADGRPRRPAGRARAAHARSVAHRICFPKYTSRAYGNAGLRTTTTARTAGRPVKWRATDSRRDIARRAALDVRGRHDARLLRDPARARENHDVQRRDRNVHRRRGRGRLQDRGRPALGADGGRPRRAGCGRRRAGAGVAGSLHCGRGGPCVRHGVDGPRVQLRNSTIAHADGATAARSVRLRRGGAARVAGGTAGGHHRLRRPARRDARVCRGARVECADSRRHRRQRPRRRRRNRAAVRKRQQKLGGGGGIRPRRRRAAPRARRVSRAVDRPGARRRRAR